MGGGRRPPLPYFGNWKEVPQFLGKNVLTGVIYGLNFPFKAPFLRVSWRIFPAWPFFFLLQMIVYRSALIPRKLPCLKNSWLRACFRGLQLLVFSSTFNNISQAFHWSNFNNVSQKIFLRPLINSYFCFNLMILQNSVLRT